MVFSSTCGSFIFKKKSNKIDKIHKKVSVVCVTVRERRRGYFSVRLHLFTAKNME